jgi:hypothetical protein
MWTPSIRVGDNVCPRCGGIVSIISVGAMRRHKRGTVCKRRREFMEMQEQDFRLVKPDVDYIHHVWPALKTFAVRGKFGMYLPTSVLEYAQYLQFANYTDYTKKKSVDERIDLLLKFIDMPVDSQHAHLDGLQLAYEVWRETSPDWFIDDDIPF